MRPHLWLLGGGGASFLQGGDHALVGGLIPIHIKTTLRNIAKILKMQNGDIKLRRDMVGRFRKS